MAPSIIIDGEEIEDLNPYLSRQGMTLLWLVLQHLGAQVSWREEDGSLEILRPAPLAEVSAWMKEKLRKWCSVAGERRGTVPPPRSLLALLPPRSERDTPGFPGPRGRGEGRPVPEKEVGGVETQKRGGPGLRDSRPAEESEDRESEPRRPRTESVAYHRPYLRDEKGSGGTRSVTESRSSGASPREKMDHLARYRPG
ncbi:MAG: hypothetical protein R6U70_06645 [Bacillota bacterium]